MPKKKKYNIHKLLPMPLADEDTIELVRLASTGSEEAKRLLVEHNLRLASYLARRYSGEKYLLGEATIGLQKGVSKLETGRNPRQISGFLSTFIGRAVKRGLNDRIVHIPHNVIEKGGVINHLQYIIKKEELAPTPRNTDYLVGEVKAANADHVRMAFEGAHKFTSLENLESLARDSKFHFDLPYQVQEDIDKIIDTTYGPSRQISEKSVSDVVYETLATLTPREETILRMRFGMGQPREHSLEEVGNVFNLTRERIRKIEIKALGKLRERIEFEKLNVTINRPLNSAHKPAETTKRLGFEYQFTQTHYGITVPDSIILGIAAIRKIGEVPESFEYDGLVSCGKGKGRKFLVQKHYDLMADKEGIGYSPTNLIREVCLDILAPLVGTNPSTLKQKCQNWQFTIDGIPDRLYPEHIVRKYAGSQGLDEMIG